DPARADPLRHLRLTAPRRRHPRLPGRTAAPRRRRIERPGLDGPQGARLTGAAETVPGLVIGVALGDQAIARGDLLAAERHERAGIEVVEIQVHAPLLQTRAGGEHRDAINLVL